MTDLLLPEGACLLHIGPFKTGTTAIQGALQDARERLPEHRVLYPGKGRRAMRPGWAVLNRKQRGRERVPIEEWERFAAEVRAHADHRVCVSTEDFGSASPEQAARIVADLGGERVHVVAVTRRLDRLLPSQWQERVKSHDTIGYDDWLRAVLGEDQEHRSWKNFWASHDVVRMYDRWAATVGPERFHLVVSDDGNPEQLPRLFEKMLGLPDGFLKLAPYSNASLSMNGIELVRRLNEVFKERGWPDELYHQVLQRGLMQQMVAASRSEHEQRIPPLPTWATKRAAEITEQRIADLTARGVHVIGDLDRLRLSVSDASPDEAPEPVLLSLESATLAVGGAVDGALTRRAKRQRAVKREIRAARAARADRAGKVTEPTGRELLTELSSRVKTRLRRTVSK